VLTRKKTPYNIKHNNMKRNKIVGIIIIACIAVSGIVLWFVIYSWQPRLKPYHINTPEASARILIAAQGRSHKIKTLDIISKYYTGKDVYISVIDTDGLSEAPITGWDYIVLFSAIRMYKLNSQVEAFLKRAADDTRIFLFNTSGGTQLGYGDVDTITSASTKARSDAETIIGIIDRAIYKTGYQ
jgi:hypothetical protein